MPWGGTCAPGRREGLEIASTGGVRIHLAAGASVRADRLVADVPLEHLLGCSPRLPSGRCGNKGLRMPIRGSTACLQFRPSRRRPPEGMGKVPRDRSPRGGRRCRAKARFWLAAQPGEVAEREEPFRHGGPRVLPSGTDGRDWILGRVREVLPFLDESLSGELV